WRFAGADGGELITAAVTLGVPHPPGYPTYVLLGKLVSFLPLGTVAWRFHLWSAVSTAAAAGLVTAIGLQPRAGQKRPSPLPAVAAGLLFACSAPVWQQALIAEVYALNLLVVAALLWALHAGKPPWLAGALFGLSLTTHLTSALLLPLLLASTPPRAWPRLAAGLPLGLAPLLAPPLLARGPSPVVWGDPTTLAGWWWLVSGRLYHPNAFGLPLAALPARLAAWGAWLAPQLAWATLLLPAARDTHAAAVPRRWLAVTAVLYVVYAAGYAQPDAYVLLLPAVLLLAMLLSPALRRLGPAALLLPLALLLINFSRMNLSRDAGIQPLAEPALQQAPPNAVVLTPGNATIFALWYAQHVNGLRPDLILVDENLFAFAWYRARLARQHPTLQHLATDDLPGFKQHNENIHQITINN
ncbi:MAG: DUF2723 domain-containing protein, partial [Anaerolineales bacterium]|nr:DUF2723 domain-containing protein [Anaerolineales bacterium]